MPGPAWTGDLTQALSWLILVLTLSPFVFFFIRNRKDRRLKTVLRGLEGLALAVLFLGVAILIIAVAPGMLRASREGYGAFAGAYRLAGIAVLCGAGVLLWAAATWRDRL